LSNYKFPHAFRHSLAQALQETKQKRTEKNSCENQTVVANKVIIHTTIVGNFAKDFLRKFYEKIKTKPFD